MLSQVGIKMEKFAVSRRGAWKTMHICVMGLNVRAKQEEMSKGSHHQFAINVTIGWMDGWMDGWTHACNGKRIMLQHRKRLCALAILLFLPSFLVSL
jgi:hypothetical protein